MDGWGTVAPLRIQQVDTLGVCFFEIQFTLTLLSERPLRNSGRGDTPAIPLLRPFDSAHASAHLRQGERNTPPLGMDVPYYVSLPTQV